MGFGGGLLRARGFGGYGVWGRGQARGRGPVWGRGAGQPFRRAVARAGAVGGGRGPHLVAEHLDRVDAPLAHALGGLAVLDAPFWGEGASGRRRRRGRGGVSGPGRARSGVRPSRPLCPSAPQRNLAERSTCGQCASPGEPGGSATRPGGPPELGLLIQVLSPRLFIRTGVAGSRSVAHGEHGDAPRTISWVFRVRQACPVRPDGRRCGRGCPGARLAPCLAPQR